MPGAPGLGVSRAKCDLLDDAAKGKGAPLAPGRLTRPSVGFRAASRFRDSSHDGRELLTPRFGASVGPVLHEADSGGLDGAFRPARGIADVS